MRLPGLGSGEHPYRLWRVAIVAVAVLNLAVVTAIAGPSDTPPGPVDYVYTNVGLIGLTVTNLGYIGNGLQRQYQPSCEYPLNSHVEHLFLGGLWVGAVAPDGTIHVTTGMQDAATLQAGDTAREFKNFSDGIQANNADPENPEYPWNPDEQVLVWSNNQNSPDYNLDAKATQEFRCVFDDYVQAESGSHTPLGLKAILRTLAWGAPYADDFVILDYAIVNISGGELRDVYVGLWNDTTVGNTERTNPYDANAPVGWNFYDDKNGAWGPSGAVADSLGLAPGHIPTGSQVTSDPGIWMTWEHDDDGEEGQATSWVGCRLLGTNPRAQLQIGRSPVSYNAWRFQGNPEQDDFYHEDPEDTTSAIHPGKYQVMGNGAFTVGETQAIDYTSASDWVGLLTTGPIPYMADGDTIHATFAMVCGADSLSLLANGKVAQLAYDAGFTIPGGPPSPQLSVAYEFNSIKLRWTPGDSLDADTGEPLATDDPRRSPEHHISTLTGKPDFEGYRIYRYRGLTIDRDPYEISTLVAEFDRIDGIGFDTGLPPMNDRGQREFVDTDLLDGFPYWYSVVSFSAPDVEEGLPSFASGFNENAVQVYPGPAARESADEGRVNVVPNPYRAGSLFDNPKSELELGRKIWFTNLPPRCSIKIFTVSGDLVRTLQHDDPVDGKLAWDVLSESGRSIASGLYVYVVTNEDSGEVQRGKLVIIK